MTKIAIVPNAAGSGTFSIEAPNSNSNRTLTLPDAAGELFTNAGGTLTGGIQTQNATNIARFNGASDQEFGNAFASVDGDQRTALFVGKTGPASCWWLDATSGTQVAVGAVDGAPASDGGGLTLWANNATSWAMGLRVNGGTQAHGSVDLPAQPIIAGQMGTAMTNPTAAQLLAFDEFWVSRGITYNSSTRRFTVPISGIYRITLNPFKINNASVCRVCVGVNTDTPAQATHFGHSYANGSTYETGCIDSIVSLAAGDYIVFRLVDGGLYNQSNDRFNQFTIAKIA
jgi:hypothetical protein